MIFFTNHQTKSKKKKMNIKKKNSIPQMQLQHLRQRLFAWKDNKSPQFTNQAFYKTMVTGNLVYDIQKTLKREMCRVQFLFLVQQWQTEMISCFVSDKKWNASVYIFVTPTGKIKVRVFIKQCISLNKKTKTKQLGLGTTSRPHHPQGNPC